MRVRVCEARNVDEAPVAYRVPPLEDDIVVFRVGERIYATAGHCPHQYYPFELGATVQPEFRDGSGPLLLVCPLHGWRFDLDTGKSPDSPMICIDRYPVVIDGGDVFVELPDDAQSA